MFRKLLDQGQAGDNVGVLLRGTKREEVRARAVLCKPGSIKPHTQFTAEVYVLSKEEGGRHTPFFNNYRPQFYFRTTDVTGAVELPKDKEMVMPGDNVSITVKLIARSRWKRACASRSARRPHRRRGVVAKIISKGCHTGHGGVARQGLWQSAVSKTRGWGSDASALPPRREALSGRRRWPVADQWQRRRRRRK